MASAEGRSTPLVCHVCEGFYPWCPVPAEMVRELEDGTPLYLCSRHGAMHLPFSRDLTEDEKQGKTEARAARHG